MKNIEITQIIERVLGYSGRMISGSKSGYRKVYPENVAVFNANLVIEDAGKYVKIWHGDVDLTIDAEKLLKISEKTGKKIYVLFEMDARFDTEEVPAINRHVASYDASQPQNLQVEIGPQYEEWFEKGYILIKHRQVGKLTSCETLITE
jgi:hypothetical protein